MSQKKKVYLRYAYHFQVGRNEHRLEAYPEYYSETGLQGKMLFYCQSSRKADIVRRLKKEPFLISEDQWKTFHRVTREKPHTIIIEPDGSVLNR